MSNYDASTSTLFTLASQALTEVSNTRNAIFNSAPRAPGTTAIHANLPKTNLSLGAPPKASDIFFMDDTADDTVVWLNAQVEEYMNKYFPAINNCLKTIPEEWLCNVISDVKPFGIDSTIFDLVWERARDRQNADGLSAKRTLEAASSAHGFSLPNGALLSATMQLEKKRADLVHEVNKEQALQDAMIKKEILLFAEEQALRYKLGLMQAMADMYKAWMIIPNRDLERAQIRAQAMAAFYSALSTYWNVEEAFEELKLKAETLRVNTELQNVGYDVEAFKAARGDQGLGQAAQAFGVIAAQASNAASTLVAQIESI